MYCTCTGRDKYKVQPITDHEEPDEEYKCSSNISSTSTLDGV